MADFDQEQKTARRKKMLKEFVIAFGLFLLGYYTFS